MSELTLAALQYCAHDQPAANWQLVQRLTSQAVDQGARMVMLPENAIFMGRHEADKLRLAEPDGAGSWQQAFADLACKHQIALVVGSFPLQVEERPDKVWPSLLVYGPSGERLARYDKLHLFDVQAPDGAAYRESRYFFAGKNEPQYFDFAGLRFGLSICYDLRFPELYRALSALGAQVFLVPAAFTYATGSLHWEVLLRARAIENLAYVLAANQCAEHPAGQRSWGHSMLVDARGQVQASLQESEGVCLGRVDSEQLAQLRQQFPALQHRRL